MGKINRQEAFDLYDGHCGYCGCKLESIKNMQVDHIQPRWMEQADPNRESNLMPTCRTCNHYKRGDDLEGFRRKMVSLHERVCSHYIGKVALKFGIVEINPFDGNFYFERVKNNTNETIHKGDVS